MIPMHMEMIGVGKGWGGVASIDAQGQSLPKN